MELQEFEKQHIEMLRPLLPECTVLLKSNGDFPLSVPGKIALYGSGVRRTIKGGTGSGEVNSRYFDTVEAGFEKLGFTITSKAWLDGYDRVRADAFEKFKTELKERAKAEHKNMMMLAMGAAMPEPEYELPLDAEGDAAIYVLSRISGEGTDRKPEKGDIFLSDTELRDISALNKKYEKFMLVLNVGGVVDLSDVMDVPNILLLSQLGVETGSALARVVLGQQYPSGKLAATWTSWQEHNYLEFGGYNDTQYQEGIYVGYRYFDSTRKDVLFPFGYGLGYTTFEISKESVTVEGTKVKVSATVSNTGKHPGKEVVQVYVSKPAEKLSQPYQVLAAWAKTDELLPGETETLEICFDMAELASFDESTAAWILEQGNYIIRVGSHSRSTVPATAVHLAENVTLCRVKNGLGKPDFEDMSLAPIAEELCSIPILELNTVDFKKIVVNYDPEYEIAEEVTRLSDEELTKLSNGSFGMGGLMSIIGNASTTISGAAGETAHVNGFKPIVMADGPAGVRINQRYFVDKKGRNVNMEAPIPQSLVPFLPKAAKFFLDHFVVKKPKKQSDIRYQYCTALPIGTAIAQSWNMAVAEVCGDVAGREMEIFGIDILLAPALNIQRSIQCGRNFEYYSEDPLISGHFAAAVTRGIQRHPGKGVSVKHYAANNQEFNRTCSNSIVSQRAMREIYLKGFEICVREGKPKTVMTSYNLLNGQHTSTRRDLIEDVLRCEFGFDGIVMTDWLVGMGMSPKDAKYPDAKCGDVAAAGGDLYMPGSEKDHADVVAALADGRLTRKQLEINATRVLRYWNK